jgi:hypothetical protein
MGIRRFSAKRRALRLFFCLTLSFAAFPRGEFALRLFPSSKTFSLVRLLAMLLVVLCRNHALNWRQQ